MPRKLILVVTDTDDAKAVEAALCSSSDDLFEVEWVGLCGDAIECLTGPGRDSIAGVVTGLDLPDSRGLETFERLVRAAPRQPILVVGRRGDEEVARQAVRRGAQDYLLLEHLDGYSLRKAVASMLDRVAHAAVSSSATGCAQLTLDSIGDAVVSTDACGRITYLNPVAAGMTGWSLQEAAGKPLQHVVRIIDAESREPVPNPLAMAMLQDETVGLGANCLLVRREAMDEVGLLDERFAGAGMLRLGDVELVVERGGIATARTDGPGLGEPGIREQGLIASAVDSRVIVHQRVLVLALLGQRHPQIIVRLRSSQIRFVVQIVVEVFQRQIVLLRMIVNLASREIRQNQGCSGASNDFGSLYGAVGDGVLGQCRQFLKRQVSREGLGLAVGDLEEGDDGVLFVTRLPERLALVMADQRTIVR